MGELFFLLADKRAFCREEIASLRNPNGLTLGPPTCAFGGSSQVSDLMPKVCDERRTNVLGLSYGSALPGPFGSSKTAQSTDSQPGTNNNVSPEIGHEADNLYGDAARVSRHLRSVYTTVQETTWSELIATSQCGEAYTVTPTQEPSWSFAPDLANDSSRRKDCTCISCCKLSTGWARALLAQLKFKCRFPSCQTLLDGSITGFYEHERRHYGQPGKYTCLEQSCPVVTKNFGDLKRHDKAKHCTNPNKEQYPCPVLWCKYSGSNGFARKDKLKSHYKNIHEGKSAPAKAGRVIKPATLRPKVSGLEGSASKQKE